MFLLTSHTHIIFKTSKVHGGLPRFPSLVPLCLQLDQSPAFRGPRDYTGLTQAIQADVPLFRSTVPHTRASPWGWHLLTVLGSKDEGASF